MNININNCYIGKITQLVDEDMYETRSIYPYMYCITNQSQIIRTYTKREDITKHKEEFLHVTLNPNMWDDCYLRLTHVKKIEFDDDGLLPCLDIKYDNTDDNGIFDYHLYNKQDIYNFMEYVKNTRGFSHEMFKNKCNRDANGLEEAKDKFITHYFLDK